MLAGAFNELFSDRTDCVHLHATQERAYSLSRSNQGSRSQNDQIPQLQTEGEDNSHTFVLVPAVPQKKMISTMLGTDNVGDSDVIGPRTC